MLENEYVRAYLSLMPKPSIKPRIVAAGLQVMFRKGYNGASVRDVVDAADAPQGSFTNHFRSKEAFAAEVLDAYFMTVRARLAEAFVDGDLPPRDRLRRYLDIITERLAADGYRRGCLIGDFSLEVVQESEILRQHLLGLYDEWLQPFRDSIAAAQAAGEVAGDFPPMELAEFLLASWQGAILRMKVEQSDAPLERFKRIAFATVFASPARK